MKLRSLFFFSFFSDPFSLFFECLNIYCAVLFLPFLELYSKTLSLLSSAKWFGRNLSKKKLRVVIAASGFKIDDQ